MADTLNGLKVAQRCFSLLSELIAFKLLTLSGYLRTNFEFHYVPDMIHWMPFNEHESGAKWEITDFSVDFAGIIGGSAQLDSAWLGWARLLQQLWESNKRATLFFISVFGFWQASNYGIGMIPRSISYNSKDLLWFQSWNRDKGLQRTPPNPPLTALESL